MLNKKLCIVSIYGPSVDDPSFFHAFFTALFEHLDCSLGLGGDPNFGLKEEMDRLNRAGTPTLLSLTPGADLLFTVHQLWDRCGWVSVS